MRIINNPFSRAEGYHCVGCDPQHPTGLKLRFFETDEGLISKWVPDPEFQGYPDILHGGIQATILDEIASWLVYVKLETAGVTKRLDISYLKPVRLSHGALTLKAWLVEQREREALIGTALYNRDEECCAEAMITYAVYPKEVALKRMHYPGIEAFRGEEVDGFPDMDEKKEL